MSRGTANTWARYKDLRERARGGEQASGADITPRHHRLEGGKKLGIAQRQCPGSWTPRT